MTTRLLENAEMSIIQKAERKVIVDTDDIKDSDHAQVTGKIISLELEFLSEKIVCTKRKGNVEQSDEELVICNSCNTMITEDSCKKLGNVILTAIVNGYRSSCARACCPLNFANFLRTPFLQNTSGRLRLWTENSF